MLHDTFEYGPQGSAEAKDAFNQLASSVSHKQELSSDHFLSRAIAFLLEARNTQPFHTDEPSTPQHYRMPDNPYSLFEGLAGTVCAWAEACVVITAKLQKMENYMAERDGGFGSDREFRNSLQDELGMPGLGVRGFL